MVDTEEMTRRGMIDAERGEPNPFYYQHYYPYRRAYDKARRRLRRPGIPGGGSWLRLMLGGILVLGLLLVLIQQRLGQSLAPPTPTAVVVLRTASPLPTRTPILPTATPTPLPPTATPVVLRQGSIAIVVIDALRARKEPSLKSAVLVTFRKDEKLSILEGPQEADGFVWWRVEGQGKSGWSAERAQDGTVWMKPAP